MKKLLLNAIGLAMLSVSLVSCTKDDDNDGGQTRLMVIHASPNAPAVDVRVNNTVALSNVPYPTNSQYNSIPSGNTNLKISPAGITTYVIDATVDLEPNLNYSVFAIDSVTKIKAALVRDDLTAPATGKSHVRFFHFSPNAPPGLYLGRVSSGRRSGIQDPFA